jgi:S1-C subfamily serine protease
LPLATAAISSDARKLRYHWKPGAIHTYMFTVEEGSGDDVRKTTGICTYNVSGNSNQVVTEEEGSGTGFVVAADGLVGTCAHVVAGAKRIEVHLGGQTYPATVVAVDPRSDVALIKINGLNLPTLALSDSGAVQLAEAVRAIGYPLSDVLGTDVKVTTGTVAGVIQSKDRGKQLQIDAAINPGNSGGPVVNGAGQVVGVASAKLSGSSVTSVGFAAPINQNCQRWQLRLTQNTLSSSRSPACQ